MIRASGNHGMTRVCIIPRLSILLFLLGCVAARDWETASRLRASSSSSASFLGTVLQDDENLRSPFSARALQDATSTSTSTSTNQSASSGSKSKSNTTNTTESMAEYCQANCPTGSSEEETSWVSAVPLAVQILMIVVLIAVSAMFSGLTLGYLGLDQTGLEIIMAGDDVANAAYAKRIYPIRKQGNLLLCTLILGNVAVNALLSILLADKAGGIVGFILSTFLIVVFGEILPQAVCARHALYIGSRVVPLVLVVRFLFYPIAFPLSFCLDKALGEELATTYSTQELLQLLQIHVQEDKLDKDTAGVMTGALRYKDITVAEVMTPLENAYMLSVDEKLNFDTIADIFKTGYSRIPVYEVSKNNVIGLLFVKDLIFIDPEDETPLLKFIQVFGRGVHVVWPVDKLGDVLRELKGGRSHMALVRDVVTDVETDPYYEIKGIITLEDIVEEILGHEIVDETDAFVDGTHRETVVRGEAFEWAKLRLLGSKIVDQKLTYTETKAITAHLLANYPKAVSPLTEDQLHYLVSEAVITVFPAATREIGQELPQDLLYEKGVRTNVCTLILSGKVTVITGADEFRTDVSFWTLLGISSLHDPQYEPDFTAFVCKGPCKCLQFSRENFTAALAIQTPDNKPRPQIGSYVTSNSSTRLGPEDQLSPGEPMRFLSLARGALCGSEQGLKFNGGA
jgi:metal transporter CNNM